MNWIEMEMRFCRDDVDDLNNRYERILAIHRNAIVRRVGVYDHEQEDFDWEE